MPKGVRIVPNKPKLPCPRCYAPMTSDVCTSKGCRKVGVVG